MCRAEVLRRLYASEHLRESRAADYQSHRRNLPLPGPLRRNSPTPPVMPRPATAEAHAQSSKHKPVYMPSPLLVSIHPASSRHQPYVGRLRSDWTIHRHAGLAECFRILCTAKTAPSRWYPLMHRYTAQRQHRRARTIEGPSFRFTCKLRCGRGEMQSPRKKKVILILDSRHGATDFLFQKVRRTRHAMDDITSSAS